MAVLKGIIFMDNNVINEELIVGNIEKYNAEKDKENGSLKLFTFLLGATCIGFLANYFNNSDSVVISETVNQVLDYITIIGALASFIGMVKCLFIKMKLHGKIEGLEELINNMANSNQKAKGIGK